MKTTRIEKYYYRKTSASCFSGMHTNLFENNLADKSEQFCLFAWISRFVPIQTQRRDNPANEWLTKQEIGAIRCLVGRSYTPLLIVVMLLPKLRTLR